MSDKLPENCPICKTKWTKTPRIVVNEYWYHCEICKKKAEDIMAEQEKAKEVNPVENKNWLYGGGSYMSYSGPKIQGTTTSSPQSMDDLQDILDEFEKMLDSDDDVFLKDEVKCNSYRRFL